MAITVRYDPASTLLQAAVQAGKGEDFWRRYTAEQQLVDTARQYSLQQAQNRQAAFQRYAAPSGGASRLVPYSQPAASSQLDTALNQFNLGPEDRARLTLAQTYGGDRASSQVLENLIGPFTGQGSNAPQSQAKQVLLQSVGQGLKLDPETQAALVGMASDPNVDMNTFRQTVSEISQNQRSAEVQGRANASLADRQLQEQQRLLMKEIDQLQKDLAAANYNPSEGPSQFNPTIREPGGNFTEGLRNLGDVFWKGQPLSTVSTGGDRLALQQYTRLQRLQQQFNDLQTQRTRLSSGPSSSATPSAADRGDLSQTSTEDLLRQLIGG